MRQVLKLSVLFSFILAIPAVAASKETPKAASAAVPSPPDTSKISMRAAAVKEGWPDTREGELGFGWVRAFGTGDSAMAEFNRTSLTAESLQKKNMEERLKTYRATREKFGKLTLASVTKSKPGELTVSLLDADLTPHEFIFEVETKEPYKLISVSRKEMRAGHGGFGFHH